MQTSLPKEIVHLGNLPNIFKKNSIASTRNIIIDWFLIYSSFLIAYKCSLLLLPFCIVVIGSRQRALSNLTHDGSHFNLFPNRKANDVVTNLFCAFPMFDTVEQYRKSHKKHHRFLGSKLDPDTISHKSYGYDDLNPLREFHFSVIFSIFFSKSALKDSLIGNLPKHSKKVLLTITCYWVIITFLISFFLSVNCSICFVLLWTLSKITSYHFIRMISEFLDHTGLEAGSAITFSRNLPQRGFARLLIHPHSDTYHIIHHVQPNIPHYNLKQAHVEFLKMSDYESAHHCDSYLFGKHSALKCWIGKCREAI